MISRCSHPFGSTIRASMVGAFMIKQLARAAMVAGACVLMSCSVQQRQPPQQTIENLEISTKAGVQVFSVEVAVTEDQRQQGLMFRKAVPEFSGMLFDFKDDQPVSMWMKNTYVSLDMIFIQSDGRIRHIAENTEPLSEKIIGSGGPVRAVLEVVAGTAQKLGIAPGDTVISPTLRR
jgi:uncharacterized membrane protein (UPF0127 family)